MRKLISTPQLQSLASQVCGIFPYCVLKFTEGTAQGFQIILLAELYKRDSEILMSIDQLTWLASLTFLSPVGTLTAGFLTQRLGSRSMAFTASLVYVVSWLLLHYSTSMAVTFAGRILAVLESVSTISVAYISEISEPQLRSRFLAIYQMTRSFGTFFSLLLGSLLYWRTIALVNLAFPIFAAVALLATPNSPAWLASRGRLDEAEEALCWLRGWVHPSQVQTEFRVLADDFNKSTSDDQDADVETADWQARTKGFFQLFLQRSFYLPLATICTIFLLYELCGVTAIHVYSAILFREMDSPIDPSVVVVIAGAMSTVGSFVVLLLVHRTGKRRLVFFSRVVVALCYGSIALIGFLELRNDYLWVPPIAIIVATLADYSGTATITYMVVSEIFPSSVRYIGTSIGLSSLAVMISVMNKSFLYVVEAIKLPGTFLLFASMNVVALIVYYFLFPETEGKTLNEIEDHFKGGKKMKNREN